MKTKDYVQDIRTKSEEELSAELTDAKKELFNLRFQNATNQLENSGRIKRKFQAGISGACQKGKPYGL